ncbi:hypothetical protein RLIN73S_02217 [Rhodanobacter lindaniclasticus]
MPLICSALTPATAPDSTALPVTVRLLLPPVTAARLTVVPVSVALEPSVTVSPQVWVPLVVTLPLSVVLPGASVVRLANAVVPPTAAPKVVMPLAFTVNACAPSTVELNVMSVPLSTRSAPNNSAAS